MLTQINTMRYFYLFGLLLTSLISMGQETQIRGFANVDYAANDQGSRFFLGQYDNYITSQVSDRVSFLSEVTFKYGNEWHLEVERVIIKYEYDNYLSLQVGKFHTPLGYWNNAYHHGIVIQPTIGRPILIIPVHTTGLWITGRDIGKLRFGYDFTVTNGIGPHHEKLDANNHKALTAGLHIKPSDELEIGISGYTDRLFAGEIVQNKDTLSSQLDMMLFVGHLAYKGEKVEVLSEFQAATNQNDSLSTNTTAFYAYAGYNVNEKWTPYVRFDMKDHVDEELYFTAVDQTRIVAGVRYSFNYLSNLKLEFGSTTIGDGDAVITWATSFAIGF
jgi:hypothetical protein